MKCDVFELFGSESSTPGSKRVPLWRNGPWCLEQNRLRGHDAPVRPVASWFQRTRRAKGYFLALRPELMATARLDSAGEKLLPAGIVCLHYRCRILPTYDKAYRIYLAGVPSRRLLLGCAAK